MSTRIFVPGHQPGLLFVFYRLWDQNQSGKSVGVIQILKSVRNTELMMESNDCLFEGWNEQTCTTYIERWPDRSEAETHNVKAGVINDKPEGD